ncbi:bifunctional riboflavin kinase/FAD synthetase [Virgibacillus alimentarius]|uniref:Riboflavin biosynthesis protein n=1 Tax=Virgibacillus alimentarius TaxID=698769 RepID=A0ABS4S433_9BACI|nr:MULTISPECIES: bifunctional riboflavin kinase/FAD synthetase [Virgibacillus]MBP2256236.1 riboflavin kinase/FMN adenylyltransferase [Virgibacillus alimentarius]HLR66183.1 bifunctional riboflavin kinase/FAD synthetase [Virgibacillus sp.]
MRTIELSYPHTLVLEELPETVSAIGFFDGIHRGHQRVIQTAVTEARKVNMESAVITFHPHPSVVLQKEKKQIQYITPLREKKEILQRLNVDRLYIITFNKELSMLSPQEFIDHFIIGLNIKHLVAGFDFSYGHKGKGDMNTIQSQSRDAFMFSTIDKIEANGEKISSTRIRKLLDAGNVERVNDLLNRHFSTYGIVIDGDKRGKTIGFPTANLRVNPEALLPKTGIYAVKVLYKNEVYEGMANLGTNPTFTPDLSQPRIEVNIFDYNNDLYGEELQIEWHAFIRDEEKFDQVDQLVKQIENDEKKIRHYFSIQE